MPRYPYRFFMKDLYPIHHKVIRYSPAAWQWCTEYLKAKVSKGVFKKVDIGRKPESTFVCAITLVPGVQFSQKYYIYT